MTRLGIAIRLFFRSLFNAAFAQQAQQLLEGKLPEPASKPEPGKAPPAGAPARAQRTEPARSDALSLLALLQREARFVDFIMEPIGAYSDAQVGAAVRDVHRQCSQALERAFALKPLMEQPEGSTVDVPAGFDAGRIRLTGNVTGQPPFKGALRHPGWEASKLQLPEWTGGESSSRVVAPAEIEIV